MTDWIKQEMHRKYHEIASLFPLMNDDEFEQLKADIAANGLMDPIWLHLNGSIIDGRNRHRACLEVSQKPHFRTWSGDGSLVSFVVSMNLHRRHLTSSQRAVVALELLPLLEAEARERQGQRTDLTLGKELPNVKPDDNKATQQAADLAQTNRQYVSDAKKLQEHAPDLLEDVKQGNKSMDAARKKLAARKRRADRKALAQSAASIEPSDKWSVSVGDIRTWQPDKKYDFIITDPPYEKEYLDLYEILAIKAHDWLKESGLIVAMCGQSYLNQIYAMMDKHLAYYWTAAYLLPGQPTPLRQRQVNTSWKPILIFAQPNSKYQGKIFGDVFTSDANDKCFHKWGQSVSGMYSLVKQICLPGQYILDPLCGAGTTGVAALKHGCLFDGIDLAQENVDISQRRLYDGEAQV